MRDAGGRTPRQARWLLRERGRAIDIVLDFCDDRKIDVRVDLTQNSSWKPAIWCHSWWAWGLLFEQFGEGQDDSLRRQYDTGIGVNDEIVTSERAFDFGNASARARPANLIGTVQLIHIALELLLVVDRSVQVEADKRAYEEAKRVAALASAPRGLITFARHDRDICEWVAALRLATAVPSDAVIVVPSIQWWHYHRPPGNIPARIVSTHHGPSALVGMVISRALVCGSHSNAAMVDELRVRMAYLPGLLEEVRSGDIPVVVVPTL